MYIQTPEELKEYAHKIAQQHKKVLLYGELGAGKTTFSQWFVEWIGIEWVVVTSPTYTYLNTYQNKLLHIDMYRLETKEQLHETGLLEQITLYDYILIERPKREELYADESRIKLEITKEKDGGRTLHLSNYSWTIL